MVRVAPWVTMFAVILVACAAPGDASRSSATSVTASASEAATAEPSTANAAFIGVWRGEHECEGIVGALSEAGFDEAAIIETVIGNGLIPGVTSPAGIPDLAQLCADTTVLEHSHEFTADGEFFSYDQDGNQVDFGTYELVDDDTVAIGDQRVEFDFAIDGDHLTLEPQVEPDCVDFNCQWAVMVAMPWSGMDRVE